VTSKTPPPEQPSRLFDRIFIIVMENANVHDVLADPYYADLAARGASFTNAYAVARPSYPNYLAMIAGETFGIADGTQRTVDAPSLVELLRERGLSWKNYAQGYPGNCFLGEFSGRYYRKHVPFLSLKSVQDNPTECAKVVPATALDADLAAETVPAYVMFTPDMDNDGHDTSIRYSAVWLETFLEPLLANERFMAKTLVVITYDEAQHGNPNNQIYTVFLGPMVRPGDTNQPYTHYSLLRLVEETFALGTLGKEDAKAPQVTGIWQ
jgi:acid phosphatase